MSKFYQLFRTKTLKLYIEVLKIYEKSKSDNDFILRLIKEGYFYPDLLSNDFCFESRLNDNCKKIVIENKSFLFDINKKFNFIGIELIVD